MCAVMMESTPCAMAASKGFSSIASMWSRSLSSSARSRWLSTCGVAVAGKMFGGHQHSIVGIGVRAVDVRGDVARDGVRIFAVGANVDDGIIGIAVDVGDRRENPLDAQSAGLAGRGQPFIARGLEIVGRAVGHVVRESGRCPLTRMEAPRSKSAPTISGIFASFCMRFRSTRHGVRLGVADLPILHGLFTIKPPMRRSRTQCRHLSNSRRTGVEGSA